MIRLTSYFIVLLVLSLLIFFSFIPFLSLPIKDVEDGNDRITIRFVNASAFKFKNNNLNCCMINRVNTYRRLDLLETFLDYYDTCDVVDQIQVVWSDLQSSPPYSWLKDLSTNKTRFEVHKTNSLNNRFRQLLPINTDVCFY